jgi:hypothetical protein
MIYLRQTQANINMSIIKKYPENEYRIFRNFVIKDKNGYSKILQPGDTIKCTEIVAQCINTMQPLTIRRLKVEAKE